MSDDAVFAGAVESLAAAGVDDPRGEARRLYGLAFPRRYSDFQDSQDGTARARFEEFVARRAAREPFSHISGHRSFWKHQFAVTSDVLDPRPDTETLVDVALGHPFERVLDLGTGSGCIVISLLAERESAHGVATDLSEKALVVARRNAREVERVHGADVTKRLRFIASDWFERVEGRFDLIVSNPPYIAKSEMEGLQPEVRNYEPRLALTDENDGLDAYRVIVRGAPAHLSPGGRLIVEIGYRQGPEVCEMFTAAGFADVRLHRDLAGLDRVVTGVFVP